MSQNPCELYPYPYTSLLLSRIPSLWSPAASRTAFKYWGSALTDYGLIFQCLGSTLTQHPLGSEQGPMLWQLSFKVVVI